MEKKDLRIVFMGTPDFAVPALKALAVAGHEVVAAYTQPPRPSGRGQRATPCPVHRAALDLGFAAVCGARVTDVPAVVRVIQEGGCFQQIRRTGGVRLLNLEA